jgi:hypothetical protein
LGLVSVFENVVVVVFKNIFYLEKYQNNIFYFLKIIFDISTLKYLKTPKTY